MRTFIIKTFLLGTSTVALLALAQPADADHKCVGETWATGCRFLEHSTSVSQQGSGPITKFEKGLEILLPGAPDISTGNPAKIIGWFFYFAMGSVGVLALIMLVVGGIQYMASAIDPAGKSVAKERVQAAITGLLLALASFLVLFTLNPDLTRLQAPKLPNVSCDCARDQNCRTTEGVPGLSEDNCVEGTTVSGSTGISSSGILNSGDPCLVNAAAKVTSGKVEGLVTQLAADGCGYTAIQDDNDSFSTCAEYCMARKNDSCDYKTNPGGACKKIWDLAQKWQCSTVNPNNSTICKQNKNSIDNNLAGKCSLLASYTGKIIDLKQKVDLCKCAASTECVDPKLRSPTG